MSEQDEMPDVIHAGIDTMAECVCYWLTDDEEENDTEPYIKASKVKQDKHDLLNRLYEVVSKTCAACDYGDITEELYKLKQEIEGE